MPGAVLRVGGTKSGIRRFLARSKLKPHRIFVRGEPAFPKSPRPAAWNGFLVTVSKADGTDLKKQLRDASRFLNRHMTELRSLRSFRLHGVIDFGVYDTRSKDRLLLSWRLPGSVSALLGQAGLDMEISLYDP
jgi:hypothetical protein